MATCVRIDTFNLCACLLAGMTIVFVGRKSSSGKHILDAIRRGLEQFLGEKADVGFFL